MSGGSLSLTALGLGVQQWQQLPRECLERILCLAGHVAAATAACVCVEWSTVVKGDGLWALLERRARFRHHDEFRSAHRSAASNPTVGWASLPSCGPPVLCWRL